jgi:hypothetical protein
MSELVNPVSAAQLKPRNSEPTHLGGASYDDIGGTDVNAEPNTAKVDGEKGVKTDTSIPKSVAAEPSHLKAATSKMAEEKEDDDDDVKVKFNEEEDDDEKKLDEADDLDKALDEAMEDDKPIEVKEESEDDEDDKEHMKEESDDEDDKKDMSEEADDDEHMKEEADDDKKMDEEADDEKKMDEEADDEKKDVTESVRIKIAMPKTSLFESAGFNAKQQKQVAALFESAVKDTARQISVKLNEAYKVRAARKIAESEKKITERLNTYLSVVIEQWMTDNRVAVRQNLRTELSENFLNGLQSLFKEHYIDVPTSKVDVVETLTKEVEALKGKLNESASSNLKLRRLAEAANKKRIVAEFARNMSETQAAKLAKLAENTDYVDAKDFREKLGMLKESYFGGKGDVKVQRLPEEDVQVVKEEARVKSEADAVADAISRQVKSSW